MTNFNGINPWMNMLNYLNASRTQSAQGNNSQAQNTQNLEQLHAQNSQMIQNLSTNVFEKSPITFLNSAQNIQTEQTAMQDMLKMNNELVQKYLQSLLDMPESLDKILKNINPKEINSQGYQFLKLFVENMLNNKELNQLLNENSNNAIQKLLNVLTQSLKTGADTAQLKDILSVLNTIHSSANLNNNTLRELFLLYIPIDYQVFKQDSDFSKIQSENEGAINESALNILFETYNFSNILVSLNEADRIIYAQVRAGQDFPYDGFKNVVSAVSKEVSLNILCDFIKIKDCGSKGQKRNFKIISDDFVSINTLNASQIIIKTIFKLDNNIEDAIEA